MRGIDPPPLPQAPRAMHDQDRGTGTVSKRVAVVDLGTNSTRLLVAEVAEGELTEIVRESTVTSLGRGVEVSGRLSAEGVEAASAAVARYRQAWEDLEVDEVAAIATSAVRDAANGDAFVAEMRERFALQARVLSGEEEAAIAFRGATAGRSVREGERTLVIDIGGGSTELVVGTGNEIVLSASLQAGVLRHTERYLQGDPPAPEELEALAADVRGALDRGLEGTDVPSVDKAFAVAGTPAALAAIELGTDDRSAVHGRQLTIEAVQAALSRLASMPLAGRERIAGLRSDRAPFIVAGTVILAQVMRVFDAAGVEVSENDVLHGLALDFATG